MDPDAILARLRAGQDAARAAHEATEAAEESGATPPDDGDLADALLEVSAAAEELDDWLRTGGYLPTDWSNAR